MKIGAVVVTYNRKQLLVECIEALLKQTCPVDEIVILDNASTDGTADFLKETGILHKECVRYIRQETNTGGAGGFYYGAKQAYEDGADWIWMMDDDCIPESTALEELNLALNFVDASFLCSMVYLPDGQWTNIPEFIHGPMWRQHLERGILPISVCAFTSFYFPRKVIEKCGLPFKGFFIWQDDIEYCRRISEFCVKSGGGTWLAPVEWFIKPSNLPRYLRRKKFHVLIEFVFMFATIWLLSEHMILPKIS